MTVMVDRMKILDGFAAIQMASDDVGRVDSVDLPSRWPRIIGRVAVGPHRMGEALLGQNALDGGRTGNALER